MSTLDATVSMLELMPEEAQIRVFQYTQQLFDAGQDMPVCSPVTAEDVLADLAVSRSQIEKGHCRSMQEALQDMGNRHGFI